MRFERSIPAPERLPDVPMRLGDCIRAFLPGATRIDVHVRAGTGWRKVNAVRLDDGDDAHDPEQLAALVKACAEHHATEANATGKYRAMVWRYFGGELERHKAAFEVELASPERRPSPPPRRSRRAPWRKGPDIERMLDGLMRPERPPPRHSRRDQWRKALETRTMLDELLSQSGDPCFDPFAGLRPEPEPHLERLHRELAEMSAIFEEGQRTGTADGMDLAEIDIRWNLALLRGQEDAEIWTELAPTIESGLAKLRKDALDERRRARDLVPADAEATHADVPSSGQADAPNAERTEGAPPLPDDAPSSGKVRSGA